MRLATDKDRQSLRNILKSSGIDFHLSVKGILLFGGQKIRCSSLELALGKKLCGKYDLELERRDNAPPYAHEPVPATEDWHAFCAVINWDNSREWEQEDVNEGFIREVVERIRAAEEEFKKAVEYLANLALVRRNKMQPP